MHYRRLIALLMMCAYLILPLDSLANVGSPFADHQQADGWQQGARSLASGASLNSDSSLELNGYLQQTTCSSEPASHCPCSDRHGSDGCNPSCSCCSCCPCCAPLSAGIAWRVAQPTDSFSMLEPFKHFPEVYLPIFVPPQNRTALL
jgi:hypothetical protein